MDEDRTVPRRIWTETLLEMLDNAVQRQADNESSKILHDIHAKGYNDDEVLREAYSRFGRNQAQRVERLIGRRNRAQRQAS